MKKRALSLNPFRLLTEVWTFFRSQPALLHVLFWFFVLPRVIENLLTMYWPQEIDQSLQDIGGMGLGLAQFIIAFVHFWGYCCVLLVGRRMVKSLAGRSRTSFRTVRRESLGLIIPVFLTSLLRSIIILYWSLLYFLAAGIFILFTPACQNAVVPVVSAFMNAVRGTGEFSVLEPMVKEAFTACQFVVLLLPLLIPAILYSIRTMFFDIVIAAENIRYRSSLRKSTDMVYGRTGRVFLMLLLASIVLLAIPTLYMMVLDAAEASIPEGTPIVVATVVGDLLSTLSGFFFTLAMIAVYGKLKKGRRVEEVRPE